MNNSSVLPEKESSPVSENFSEKLGEREAKVLKIIEAIREISSTKAWSTLKENVFDGAAELLKKDLLSESRKEDPDPKKLTRLSGKLEAVEKYDLSKLEKNSLLELQSIRIQRGKPE